MATLPRRLPPTPEERLKVILAHSSAQGSTRFEGTVTPTPTTTAADSSKVYVQDDEPLSAGIGDMWIRVTPPVEP
jgi:hypothetical protein